MGGVGEEGGCGGGCGDGIWVGWGMGDGNGMLGIGDGGWDIRDWILVIIASRPQNYFGSSALLKVCHPCFELVEYGSVCCATPSALTYIAL